MGAAPLIYKDKKATKDYELNNVCEREGGERKKDIVHGGEKKRERDHSNTTTVYVDYSDTCIIIIIKKRLRFSRKFHLRVSSNAFLSSNLGENWKTVKIGTIRVVDPA